jgi:DNA-binding GntR family transcriptional regulator
MAKTESNRSRAYEFLRDEVIPDSAFHGAFLTEEEVAARIGGISRTPVREAFLLLAAEGLLQLIPRHGALIPPVTREEVREVLAFRRLLETDALATLHAEGRLPVEKMQSVLDQQAAAASGGSAREFIELDTEFHLALVSAQGNSLITKVYSDLKARNVRIGMSALVSAYERRAEVLAEHSRILDAMRSGDEAAAVHALRDHLASTEGSITGRR